MEICIDFDGTCVTHDYPNVGASIGAVPVLRQLVECGHHLILFTMRSESQLMDACKWFTENQIPLYGIQLNPGQHKWTNSNKAYGHLYIDDAALGCPLKVDKEISDRPFVDWVKAREWLSKKGFLDNL